MNPERILVCVGPSPSSARLVRVAHELASRTGVPWLAAVVMDPDDAGIGPDDRARVDEHLQLAESLGGEIARLSGPRVAATLLDYARLRSVGRIVVGKPRRRALLGKRSIAEEILRECEDIDLHIVSGEEPLPRRSRISVHVERTPIRFVLSALAVAATTALAFPLARVLGPEAIGMLYLLTIMVVAFRLYRGPAFFAAALSVAAFDFFFVEPAYTFAVKDPRHLLTFVVMFTVGLAISSLTVKVLRQGEAAREREGRTRILYELGRELASARDVGAVAEIACRRLGEAVRAEVALVSDDAAITADAAIARDGAALIAAARETRRPASSEDGLHAFPILVGGAVRGVFAIRRKDGAPIDADQRALIDAVSRPIATEIERARVAADAEAARVQARTEELRSALLSTVSHDLRTPLATITGAATRLRDAPEGTLDAAERGPLVESICTEAERLERLLVDLLAMTRLESGGLDVRREWIPIEEIVGAALSRLESALADRPIVVRVPDEASLVAVDPVLFSQVLVNLLENALKYTPPKSPIEVRASVRADAFEIEVADRGPGIPGGAEARIFEKFVRGDHPGVGGVGLGLAICRGMIVAHGGTITAQNRPGGGAVFRIHVPQEIAPTDLPPELPPASLRRASA
ncbi:MAG: DUF4118 domain-containing protein [Polyangiaceae bacterium]